MLPDVGNLNQETDTTMGKLLAASTATLLIAAKGIPDYMEIAQMYAWYGAGSAGFMTAAFYLYRFIKKKF